MSAETAGLAVLVGLVVGATIAVCAIAAFLHWSGKRKAKRLAAMTDEERADEIDRNAW